MTRRVADATPAPSSSRRGTRAGREARQRLLAAVALLVETRGVGALSVADVARAAGCAKASVLYHYASREALLEATIAGALGPWWRAQREALARPIDPRLALDGWLEAAFAATTPVLRLRAQLDAAPPAETAAAALAAQERDVELALERLLARGHLERCWQVPRAAVMATTARAVFDGLVLAALRSGDDAALAAAHAVCRSALLDLLVRR